MIDLRNYISETLFRDNQKTSQEYYLLGRPISDLMIHDPLIIKSYKKGGDCILETPAKSPEIELSQTQFIDYEKTLSMSGSKRFVVPDNKCILLCIDSEWADNNFRNVPFKSILVNIRINASIDKLEKMYFDFDMLTINSSLSTQTHFEKCVFNGTSIMVKCATPAYFENCNINVNKLEYNEINGKFIGHLGDKILVSDYSRALEIYSKEHGGFVPQKLMEKIFPWLFNKTNKLSFSKFSIYCYQNTRHFVFTKSSNKWKVIGHETGDLNNTFIKSALKQINEKS